MTRFFTDTITKNGAVFKETIRPWSRNDYFIAIQDIEALITPRRMREALLSDAGRLWLVEVENQIQALRDEMDTLE